MDGFLETSLEKVRKAREEREKAEAEAEAAVAEAENAESVTEEATGEAATAAELPEKFEESREWSCFRGDRLDFYANDVSLEDEAGKPLARDFDLHPYVIQKFEIYNAFGCGLFNGGQAIGRLLLINRASEVRKSDWKKLQETAPSFGELVRHLLVVKNTEQEAYDRERARMAHDLHDGPLTLDTWHNILSDIVANEIVPLNVAEVDAVAEDTPTTVLEQKAS